MGEGGGSGGGEEELESRTHVSLLMLPRCMVTTKRPGTGLTRLRPPGMTVQTPAAETEKALDGAVAPWAGVTAATRSWREPP